MAKIDLSTFHILFQKILLLYKSNACDISPEASKASEAIQRVFS